MCQHIVVEGRKPRRRPHCGAAFTPRFISLKIRALSEATYYAGLRKAGMPEE
jgi:hypothetical protein